MKTSFYQRWWPWGRTTRPGRPLSRRWPRLEVLQLEERTLLSGTPQLLADINPGAGASNPAQMIVIGSEAYFVANDGTHGNELWKTDGTSAGTVTVAGIDPSNLTNVNGELFFSVCDGSNDYQLWKSDGTAAGTVMVKDMIPSQGYIFPPSYFTNVNGTLFFTANYQLWKSDGTAAGTTTLAGDSNTPELTNVNGELFFCHVDFSTNQNQLWKSDGTAAGTTMVSALGRPSASSDDTFPQNLTNVNGELFFTVPDGATYQLWKSDGTAAGTTMFESFPGYNAPSDLTNVNGTLYFSANDGTHGAELWKSDGTAASTVLVKDIDPGTAGSYPWQLTNVNGTLYFSANDGTHGLELWKSDGTAAGTIMVKDINPGTTTTWYSHYSGATYDVTDQNSDPHNLTNVNGTLYFSANDGAHGYELWQSDGTAAGTTMVQDIYPGTYLYTSTGSYGAPLASATLPNSSSPSNLTNLNGTLLFTANDGVHGNELWVLATGTTNVPTVGGISPSDGPTSGGTTVTISGSNLGTTATATVDFGAGNPATIVSDNGADRRHKSRRQWHR